MKSSVAHPASVRCSKIVWMAALGLCACIQAVPALAEEFKVGGVEFWTRTEDAPSPAGNGPSLLRPPASWSWDVQAPTLDFAAGIGHRFQGGLGLDAGVSVAHAPELATPMFSNQLPDNAINYRDYFLGLSFGALEGKIWYLPENDYAGEPSVVYYEAGWAQPVTDKVSLSLRVGQYDGGSSNRFVGPNDMPSLSLGASTTLDGYGFGLRLIDGGGRMFGGEQDLQLMGSISKPLH